jgi:hypothetical protein
VGGGMSGRRPDNRASRQPYARLVAAPNYSITLSRDVALVLFEWLEQREETDWVGVPVAHSGEHRALSQLGGALEKTLPEVFDAHYSDVLSAACDRLAAKSTSE